MKTQFKIEVELEHAINPIETTHVFHDVEVEVEHHIEKNYGADLDGERGMDFRNIDAVKVISVDPQCQIIESIQYQIERVAIEQLDRHL